MSGLIGPAYGYMDEREVVDKEAYDEELITVYICDACGEHKE